MREWEWEWELECRGELLDLFNPIIDDDICAVGDDINKLLLLLTLLPTWYNFGVLLLLLLPLNDGYESFFNCDNLILMTSSLLSTKFLWVMSLLLILLLLLLIILPLLLPLNKMLLHISLRFSISLSYCY